MIGAAKPSAPESGWHAGDWPPEIDDGMTGAGKAEASPTVKLEPSASASLCCNSAVTRIHNNTPSKTVEKWFTD
jgi:hypothetical protein